MTLDFRSVRNSNPKEAELAVNWARLSDAKNGTWCGDRPARMSHSFLHCASMSAGKIRAVSAGGGVEPGAAKFLTPSPAWQQARVSYAPSRLAACAGGFSDAL